MLTSNLGSEILAAQAEAEPSRAVREEVMAVVRRTFRPEFLNRLDEIILFNRLGRAEMKGIVEIQLRRLDKLLAERKIRVAVDEKARAWLAEAGYDPVYGARPLKRAIQRNLQNPLADLILEGRIAEGESVTVSAGKSALIINGVEIKAEAA